MKTDTHALKADPTVNTTPFDVSELLNWVPTLDPNPSAAHGFGVGGVLCENVPGCSFEGIKLLDIVSADAGTKSCLACLEQLYYLLDNGRVYNYYDLLLLVRKIVKGLELSAAKPSVKSIAKRLQYRTAAVASLARLQEECHVINQNKVIETLKFKVASFDQSVQEFYQSPQGEREILREVAKRNLQPKGGLKKLLAQKHGVSSERLTKEIKQLQRSLNDTIENFATTSIYSICYFEGSLAERLEGSSLWGGGNRKEEALEHLVSMAYLQTSKQVIALPRSVAAFIKGKTSRREVAVIHTGEKPSDRTLECMNALLASDSELSLRQIYDAALAID